MREPLVGRLGVALDRLRRERLVPAPMLLLDLEDGLWQTPRLHSRVDAMGRFDTGAYSRPLPRGVDD